jgi:prephenate dehydrogenase
MIIGMGLVGGSLAGALKAADAKKVIFGVDVDAKSVSEARRLGIIDAGVSFPPEFSQEAAMSALITEQDPDIIVLSVPIGSFETWFRSIAAADYTGVVTDVGSTKEPVINSAEALLPRLSHFVPGHPMAGSEAGGIHAARADLFEGAYWVLTPLESTDIHVFRRLHTLLTSIGARVISVDAAEHDRAVAVVSHVPHITASSLVTLAERYAGDNGDLLRLAAGGFKDTTRVAAGSPQLWTDIVLNNAGIIAEELDDLTKILASAADMIRSKDEAGVFKLLKAAADVRRSLPAKWVPESAKLTEVRIPMDNRPGIIADITAAAGRTGCNIQAIEIDHQTEDRAILQLTLTDEGQLDAFLSALRDANFKPFASEII